MMEMRYSALNSRLLLPPRTTNDPGTLGPMDRMSKPRTLYSPPRNNRSKTGRNSVRAKRRDVLGQGAEPDRGPRQVAEEENRLASRLVELCVAAKNRQID